MTTRSDPAMLNGTSYPRSPLDFYPTMPKTSETFVEVYGDDLESYELWEPFAGNGALFDVIAPHCRTAVSTDLVPYEGDFTPTAFQDFFAIHADPEAYADAVTKYEAAFPDAPADDPKRPVLLADLYEKFGTTPDAIITNPPYGKAAEASIVKALELMQPTCGLVAFLMRHEYDCAKTRRYLFDEHPAFTAKVTLLHRPKWVEKQPGEKESSPRFSYAWYVWDWRKALNAPHSKAEMFYAG